ncbi:MAG: DUF2147 domain-containing protein [Alphaproteobacteria bacterium]|nr:DUF2147 domain-containing protein [Alphaproteobacteria bacterium]
MYFHSQFAQAAIGLTTAALGAVAWSTLAQANSDPRGIWYDHNGRGAVEIKECASNASRLCGHVVYVKKARNKKRCGMQIIGNVRSNGRGWIYSPKRGRSYALALKRLSENRLRIIGNANSRYFSKTYTWKRAPASVVNCGKPATVAKAKTKAPVKQAAAPAPKTKPVVDSVAKTAPVPTTAPVAKPAADSKPKTAEADTGTASTGSAALFATSAAAATATPEPAPEVVDAEADAPVDDLSPPGGLTKGGDDRLGKLKSVIDKFTGGKGLKGFSGKGKGKCKFRIPYVGRTINVPCK